MSSSIDRVTSCKSKSEQKNLFDSIQTCNCKKHLLSHHCYKVSIAAKRGKCVFNDVLGKKYPFIERDEKKTKSDVKCKVCGSQFSIASAGKSDIEKHLKSDKHKNKEREKSVNHSLLDLLPHINYQTAACEGVWARCCCTR